MSLKYVFNDKRKCVFIKTEKKKKDTQTIITVSSGAVLLFSVTPPERRKTFVLPALCIATTTIVECVYKS